MNEFMDLIFSQNDALNVDLSRVSKVEGNAEDIGLFERDDGIQMIEEIRKDAEGLNSMRALN